MVFSDTHERRLAEAEEALAAEFGAERVRQLVCDVTDEAQVQALLDVADELGGADIMVNNAGLGGTASVLEMTDEQWSRVLDITLTGTFRCVRAAGQRFVASGKKGVIVNNASVIGWRAQEGQAHYAAAKAGVMALTRCAAIDLAPHGIRVNAVSPSLAMHPFLAKVTSDELLARAQAARGLRPRRGALGGRQRDGLPGERLRVLHDRRGRRRLEPAGVSHDRRADRRPDARSCSRSPRASSPRRASATPRSATSPTRPGSCPAASTTTSTPRSRWSTRSSPRSRRSCSASTTRSWPATRTPATKLERAVLVSFDAIDRHHDEVAIFQNDAVYLLTFERFAYLADRNKQSREVWLTLLQAGIDAGELRDDLDLELTYRFIRDTVWVAVSWYRPGGRRTHSEIAQQYLSILLEGVSEASRLRRSRSDRLETTQEESETKMPEAYIVDAVRTPVGKRGGGARGDALRRPGRALALGAGRADRDRPGRGRRRDPRLLRHDRLAGRRRRPDGVAGGRPARPRAGRDHRPAVRLLAAGGALRRPGRDVRHPGPGGRRRRAEHERHPDLRGHAGRPAVRLRDTVRRVARLAGALRRPGGQPVPLGAR